MDATVIEQCQQQPFQVRFGVNGPLDGPGADLLAEQFTLALLADVRVVVVDLANTARLDHDGLRALVALHAYSAAAGVSFEVANAPPLLRHLLALAALEPDDIFSYGTGTQPHT